MWLTPADLHMARATHAERLRQANAAHLASQARVAAVSMGTRGWRARIWQRLRRRADQISTSPAVARSPHRPVV
jgi:hypothetical protein